MNRKKAYFMSVRQDQGEVIIKPTIETLTATLSTGLSYMGSAKVGNYIYVFGGAANAVSDKIFKFDITTETISQLTTTIPVTLSLMGCGVYGQYIYLVGGFNGSARVKTIYKFDTSNDTISLISAELPAIRSNFGCAQVGSKLYVIAGYSTASQKDIMVFDMSNETVSTLGTELPSIRHNLLAVAKGTDIYIFGGQDSSVYRDAYILDTTDNSLTALSTTMPDCQSYFGGLLGEDIYIFGGSNGSTIYNTIYKFDPSDNSLSQLSITCPEAVYSSTFTVVNDRSYYYAYYFGGNTAKYSYTKKIVKFSLEKIIPTLPSAYQEVEYIESSGTQYIDTGYKHNTFNTKYETNFAITSDANQFYTAFGSRITYDGNEAFYLGYRGTYNTAEANQKRWFTCIGGTHCDYFSVQKYVLNQRYTMVGDKDGWVKDGVTMAGFSGAVSNTTATLNDYIFADNDNGNASEKASVKLYWFKIYESGFLIRDFVPCYRKSDGEIGLYDLVNDVFYTNQGTGKFFMGPDVNPDKVIYGVSGLYQSATALTRTDDAVGMTWSMTNNLITSDFDLVFPYNKMQRVTVDGNVMVYVPEIYWRFGKDSNGYITDVAVSNYEFTAHTGEVVGHTDAFYFSAYKGSVSSSTLKSVSGASVQYSQTRPTFRTEARANGTGYQIMDLLHMNILHMLWLIEFADKNSQSIMKGYQNKGASTGATDSMTTPTGQLSDGGRMRWHYIEDFIGNGCDWFDGICGLYVTSDPSQFGETLQGTAFTYSGTTGTELTALGFADENEPLLFVPKLLSTNSSWNTYYCDLVQLSSSASIYGTGVNDSSLANGLFWWGNAATTFSHGAFCSRIIKI